MNARCRLFTPETNLQFCCMATRCRPNIHVGIALGSRFARGKCNRSARSLPEAACPAAATDPRIRYVKLLALSPGYGTRGGTRPLFDQMNARCHLFTPETGLQLCCVATRCRPHVHVGIALGSRFARGKCNRSAHCLQNKNLRLKVES